MSWYRKRSRKQRSGQTLILVVLLIFGIMALAALVIDIGYARLAQRQMQTAVDSAALEGLRGRDAMTETERRQQAKRFGELVFDDDLDTTDDPRNFGAGPIVEFSGGVGDPSLNAGQTIDIPAVPAYKPQLELNLANDPDGDMIANGDEFSVQMRRTGETPEAGVSSSGPTSPLLFGRGALLLAAGASDPNSIWNQGIRVRATANAEAYPAMSVGPPVGGLKGALPLALYRSTLGTIPTTSPAPSVLLTTVGFTTDANLMSFGEQLSANIAVSLDGSDGFAAVVEDLDATLLNRIVGFVYLQSPTLVGNQLTTTLIPNRIADENATATIASSGSATPAQLTSLFEIRNLIHTNDSPLLLAPAFVR